MGERSKEIRKEKRVIGQRERRKCMHWWRNGIEGRVEERWGGERGNKRDMGQGEGDRGMVLYMSDVFNY